MLNKRKFHVHMVYIFSSVFDVHASEFFNLLKPFAFYDPRACGGFYFFPFVSVLYTNEGYIYFLLVDYVLFMMPKIVYWAFDPNMEAWIMESFPFAL